MSALLCDNVSLTLRSNWMKVPVISSLKIPALFMAFGIDLWSFFSEICRLSCPFPFFPKSADACLLPLCHISVELVPVLRRSFLCCQHADWNSWGHLMPSSWFITSVAHQLSHLFPLEEMICSYSYDIDPVKQLISSWLGAVGLSLSEFFLHWLTVLLCVFVWSLTAVSFRCQRQWWSQQASSELVTLSGFSPTAEFITI